MQKLLTESVCVLPLKSTCLHYVFSIYIHALTLVTGVFVCILCDTTRVCGMRVYYEFSILLLVFICMTDVYISVLFMCIFTYISLVIYVICSFWAFCSVFVGTSQVWSL